MGAARYERRSAPRGYGWWVNSLKKISAAFDVSYHATFYFFWVQTTLRCQTRVCTQIAY